MGLCFPPTLRAARVLLASVFVGFLAGCGSSSPTSSSPGSSTRSALRNSGASGEAHTSGWTAGDKRAYLSSCHSQALRGVAGVSRHQRVKYCATQLKNAERYNPRHKNVHGFVGAYSVSGAGQTSSATPSTTARGKPARRGVVAIPKGYSGLGALKSSFAENNTTQGPSNISGAPRGLAWFPVTSTNGRGQVTGYSMYADASPPFSASDQIAMLGFGINTPEDKRQLVDHPDCAVITSASLRRMLDSPYEVITVRPIAHDDGIPVTEADVSSSASPSCPAGF
jgi:hypothetical protein